MNRVLSCERFAVSISWEHRPLHVEPLGEAPTRFKDYLKFFEIPRRLMSIFFFLSVSLL